MEPRLLEVETWQLQTLVNGKAKGSQCTVLVGPHRDSMKWVGNSWKPDSTVCIMKHWWICQESEETKSVCLRCTRYEVLLLVRSQSREGRWVTCAQHYVKCSPGWGVLSGQNLHQLIKSLSWEKLVSQLPINSHKCFSITSFWNRYRYLKSRRSKSMVIMVEQKIWGRADKSCLGGLKKKKQWSLVAVSTRER